MPLSTTSKSSFSASRVDSSLWDKELRATGRVAETMHSRSTVSVGGFWQMDLYSSRNANLLAAAEPTSATRHPNRARTSRFFSCCLPFAKRLGMPLSALHIRVMAMSTNLSNLFQVLESTLDAPSTWSSFAAAAHAPAVSDRIRANSDKEPTPTGASLGQTARKPSRASRTPVLPSSAGRARSAFLRSSVQRSMHCLTSPSSTSSYAATALACSLSSLAAAASWLVAAARSLASAAAAALSAAAQCSCRLLCMRERKPSK
mmetsp:Transcript_19059/g.44521  ORF Transcript_19059/g.44521 Transcript_19059/m.44521 type:complete len:260 (+) Transcript_19059:583-1362(+)